MNSVSSSSESIAIIGMAGRFPGSSDLEQFWQQLCAGRDALKQYGPGDLRNSLDAHDYQSVPYVERQMRSGNWVAAGYPLVDADKFDAGFFGYSPNEAELIDPQQRLFLESAWAAMEDAGYVPDAYPGAVGTFAGTGLSRYFLNNVFANREIMCGSDRDLIAGIGNEPDYLTNRVAYKLNLTGPSITVQTACSTSLVAIHLACQSLRQGECDLALGGGAIVVVPDGTGYQYQEGSMNSADGRIRTFDATASGTVFSEGGVGVVVLKRLSDAQADGDFIYAVIRGSAVNNDGNHKAGYTAPGVDGQVDVINRALKSAGTDAREISYVEAHGTGTLLGDPIELTALTRAFRAHTQDRAYCAIGSVKTNVGHLAPAAGVASVIKAALAACHGMIPPSLHYQQPNPRIDFADSPFYVATELTPWQPSDGSKRVASVSSFGIGGTNAHLILEEPPAAQPTGSDDHLRIFPLSAKAPGALVRNAEQLAAYLQRHPDTDLDDVALTLQEGRAAFDVRAAVAATDRESLLAGLAQVAAEPPRQAALSADRPLAWMFTGQGSQYAGMAADLYAGCPVFADAFDGCCEVLAEHLEGDLRGMLLAPRDDEGAQATLRETRYAQPALFVVEYALAQQLLAWQIEPAAMIGHSLGEYVAATLAGVFELEDALALVALRGRLMHEMEPGAMLSIPLDEAGVTAWLGDGVDLAAINSPRASVVAGTHDAIDALAVRLEQEGVACRKLQTSHAFHSAMMKPLAETFRAAVAQVSLRAPQARVISNLSGRWLTAEEACDPDYWVRHLLSPVRFQAGLATLLADGFGYLVEVGPGGVLTAFARHQLAGAGRAPAQPIACLPHPTDATPGALFLRQALAKLWAAGYPLDFASVENDNIGRRIPLPTYAFARERHWLDAPKAPSGLEDGSRVERGADLGDWFHTLSWRREPWGRERGLAGAEPVWVLEDDTPAGEALTASVADALAASGIRVIGVRPGEGFVESAPGRYVLDGTETGAWEALLAATGRPQAIIHAWLLAPTGGASLEQAAEIRRRAFDCLLALTQAVADEAEPSRVALLTVASELFDVVPGETLDAVKATVLGPHLSIGHEYRQWVSRALDVPAVLHEDPVRVANLALDELARLQRCETAPLVLGEKCTAWRGGARWLADVTAARLEAPTAPWTASLESGPILITGGLGGIGLSFAETLVREGARQLVLVGRSALPPAETWPTWLEGRDGDDPAVRRVLALQALAAQGAEVLAETADMTDPASVDALVKRVRARFGRIGGVIHAAGVAGGGVMALKSAEAAATVLDPKITGALALEQALRDEPPAFFVLVSSLFAVIGGPGQVDYCAANNMLDAFARQLAARGWPALSLAYGGWREVGMAVATGHTASAPALPPGRSETHPFLFAREDDGDSVRFIAHWRAEDHWALMDHRIGGVSVMPGTGLVEMVRAAWQAWQGQADCALSQLYFYRPLFVPAGARADVRLTFNGNGEQAECEIADDSGPILTVTVGPVSAARPAAADLSALQAVCGHDHLRFGGKAALAGDADFLSLGGRWQVVHDLHLGEREMLAELKLPEAFHDDLEQFGAHPALLDMATGPITGHLLARLLPALEDEYLPYRYGRLDLWESLPADLLSHVVYRGIADDQDTIHLDITLMRRDGSVVAAVTDFCLRRVPAEAFSASTGTSMEAWEDDGSISPQEGCEALVRALAQPGMSAHWVFNPHPLSALLRRMRADRASEAGRDATRKAKVVRDAVMTTPPGTPEEEVLVAIIEEVLGVTPVGVHDNFFDLGVDSVIGIQVVAHAKKHGVHLKPNQLFEHQTIAELAAVAARSEAVPAVPEPAALAPTSGDLEGADLDAVRAALGTL